MDDPATHPRRVLLARRPMMTIGRSPRHRGGLRLGGLRFQGKELFVDNEDPLPDCPGTTTQPRQPTGQISGWKQIINTLAMTYGDRLGINDANAFTRES